MIGSFELWEIRFSFQSDISYYQMYENTTNTPHMTSEQSCHQDRLWGTF